MAFKVPAKRPRESSHLQPGIRSRAKSSTVSMSSSRPPPAPVGQTPAASQPQPMKRVTLHPPTSRANSVASSQPVSLHAVSGRANSIAPGDAALRPEDDAAIDEREDNDAANEVVMALDIRDRGTVGCCYYVAREEKLYFMDDVKFGGMDVVDSVKLYAQPTVILLSSRVDEAVYEHLDPEGRSRDSVIGEGDQFRLPYILEIRPSPEFAYETGKRKLVDIQPVIDARPKMSFITPGEGDSYDGLDYLEAGFTNRQGKILQLSGRVDLESRLSVGCAGAVITYLARKRAATYLPGDVDAHQAFRISTIETFSLKGVMFINADALASLQIMQSESHPHSHNQGPTQGSSGSKEGLSVYGLFHHLARTPQGKQLLRQYFLRPSLDLDLIKERHDTATVFLQHDNDIYLDGIVRSLKGIKNMHTVMIHLRKGMSNGTGRAGGIQSGVWSSLRSFTYHTMGIRRAFVDVLGAEHLIIRAKVLEKFESAELGNLGRIVTDVIDFKESAEMHRTVVKPGVDDQLDEMKRTYAGIEDILNQTSQNIAKHIPPQYSLDLNVIFFPQIGFLISMPIDPETQDANYTGGEGEEQPWERIFSTAARVYFKDFRMIQLDETFGDIYAVICDKEIEIVHELAQEVLKYEAMLCAVSDICGELDCLLALAQGAKMHKLTRPRLTTENIVRIKGGRHFLQERTVPSYVANDAFLVGGSGSYSSLDNVNDAVMEEIRPSQQTVNTEIAEGPSMLIMTGPNYSGKSVFLKQIALIVYMAHVGCFVPADRATVGLTDKILTRIATKETVSKIQSAFMIDLQQVSSAIHLATHRSLVIIDEFGKGTNAADGAGLACGVFEYFLGLGDDRPKVLGATHFHEIFEHGFLKPRPELTFGHMEVRTDDEADDTEHQITYLYKQVLMTSFRPGRSTSSYGTLCAEMNGIDKSIIDRADELILLGLRGEDLVEACTRLTDEESREADEDEETARRFLAWDLHDQNDKRDPRHVLEQILDNPNFSD